MDAATLRIILIVLGGAFLLGLYFWERRRGTERDDEESYGTFVGEKREPNLGVLDPDAARAGPDMGATAPPESGAGPAGEGADVGDEKPAEPAPSMLIQLFVVAKGDPFPGERVLKAAEHYHLTAGERDIFHLHSPEGASERALFSMANLFKPGSFPFDDMDGFNTRGLALFAQLEGAPSDLMVFDEMLQVARGIAEELGGELQERDRAPLSVEKAQALRGRVLELIQGQTSAPIDG